jgi:hypothetical protein
MDTILPQQKKALADAKKVMDTRKGVMDKTQFNLIWSCLHADGRKSVSDKKLNEAFNLFAGLEKRLLREKDSPTTFVDLPDNWNDWEKMRRKPTKYKPGGLVQR